MMEVFLIDEGDCQEWIIAESIDDAKKVIVENRCSGLSRAKTWAEYLKSNYETEEDYEITQLPRDTVIPITDTDDKLHPTTRKTAEEWMQTTERGTLASTEF